MIGVPVFVAVGGVAVAMGLAGSGGTPTGAAAGATASPTSHPTSELSLGAANPSVLTKSIVEPTATIPGPTQAPSYAPVPPTGTSFPAPPTATRIASSTPTPPPPQVSPSSAVPPTATPLQSPVASPPVVSLLDASASRAGGEGSASVTYAIGGAGRGAATGCLSFAQDARDCYDVGLLQHGTGVATVAFPPGPDGSPPVHFATSFERLCVTFGDHNTLEVICAELHLEIGF